MSKEDQKLTNSQPSLYFSFFHGVYIKLVFEILFFFVLEIIENLSYIWHVLGNAHAF